MNRETEMGSQERVKFQKTMKKLKFRKIPFQIWKISKNSFRKKTGEKRSKENEQSDENGQEEAEEDVDDNEKKKNLKKRILDMKMKEK